MNGKAEDQRAQDAGNEPWVTCPRCKKPTRYGPSNPCRPFCGPACKNEDLVDWAEERYRMPAEFSGDDDDLEQEDFPAPDPDKY